MSTVKDDRTRAERGLVDLLIFGTTRKIVALWLPFCVAVAGLAVWLEGPCWVYPGGAVVGVLAYTLIEYLAHRYVYHVEPEARILRFITGDVGRKHMGHHRSPEKYGGGINSKQLPILAVASVCAAAAALSFAPAFFLTATAAGALNYALQEFVHFGTHHLPMRNRLAALMKRHHMLHHYRDAGSNFGLFWPFWDYVFGTDHTARRKKGEPALR